MPRSYNKKKLCPCPEKKPKQKPVKKKMPTKLRIVEKKIEPKKKPVEKKKKMPETKKKMPKTLRIIEPKKKPHPTANFKGSKLSVGHGHQAIPLDGEYDAKKNMIRVKTRSAKFHFGREFGVGHDQKETNNWFPDERMWELGEYTYQEVKPIGRLMRGHQFVVGTLGKGGEDSYGHNVAPALKSQGQKYYATYGNTGRHVNSFLGGIDGKILTNYPTSYS